ncbi:nitroreductase [Paenibacillus forsythiae]|uniref:Nitroreductase n=1 Tax=Paenibacillus forsythiae TaxID=365616 RepID=A0ABU3H2A7_9BACL|nr:nitroreductase family protein [Paenibacillus forsythiae]MDT3424960.1 nitroreductase [Paenibacillus forsythiae]
MEITKTGIARIIRDRRTIRDFNGEPMSRETVIELLNDAVWAPFHSAKEPWRFILFMGEGRKVFADAVINAFSKEESAEWIDWAIKTYLHLSQAHLLVVIKSDPRQKYFEDAFLAAGAMIQNLQLLAWERKVGVVWKTSDYTLMPKFLNAVGVKPGERVVGALHMGYFDESKIPRPKKRMPVNELLTIF